MNKILDDDINKIINHPEYFSPFEDSSLLITGSTGLLGSIIIKSLLAYSKKANRRINVYAACRSKEKFEKVFAGYQCQNLIPIFGDISDLNIESISVDYVIHGASITDSKMFVEKPVDTINIAINGTVNLINQLVKKQIKGFVYLSSLEVYGSFKDYPGIKDVLENDSGYLDPMSVRSSYSESKRLVETICKSYNAQYNFPAKVARLCQSFGAGVEYNDNRVFAQFARSIIEEKDIVLKTKGETIRNYCYTTDAATGILTVLAKGIPGEAYNIANPETTCSIAEMAQKFCSQFPESKTNLVFDIAEDAGKLGYNPTVKFQLNPSKLQKLGWNPQTDFSEMIKRLVEGMKS